VHAPPPLGPGADRLGSAGLLRRPAGGPAAARFVLALDVGGTKLAAGVVRDDGEVMAFARTATRVLEGPRAVLERLVALGRAAIAEAAVPEHLIEATGIGCGGPLDPVAGVVQGPPGLPGWDHVPIVDIVAEAFGRPAYLENDATAAVLGQYRYGPWTGVRHMVYVTVSTGVGGGMVLNGQLHRGAAGNGGELGHLVIDPDGRRCGCGQRGCLEAYASGSAIAVRAREALAGGAPSALRSVGEPTAEDVARAAAAGDPVAVRVWDETTAALGLGLAVVINLVEPELVVLGGGVTRAGDMLLAPVRRVALARAMRPAAAAVRIVLSGHGDRVGVVGAAAVAIDRLRGGVRT
jgi:glucokinase